MQKAFLLAVVLGLALILGIGRAQASGPSVASNVLVDQDHNLKFSENKQNEPTITRDPLTGVLVAGANDEIQEPLCPGTATPLASPCPFDPSVSVNGFYRSTDNGQTWTGGILPNPPGRTG